jgi:hypothetical protein
VYKFILKEITNNWVNAKDFIFTCSLNNKIPYTLKICVVKQPAHRGDYYLSVHFESTDTNRETYSQFNDFVDTRFFLNKHFDYVFKPNSDNGPVPLEIEMFLRKKTVRRNLLKGLNNVFIRTYGV